MLSARALACGLMTLTAVAGEPAPSPRLPVDSGQPAGQSSPIESLLQRAKQAVAFLENDVRDYSAVLVKRERVGGRLGDAENMFVKIRHSPFSVFLHFLEPGKHKGDEAIYVEGRNDGKLLGHTTGMTGRLVGTVSLDPNGFIAMDGQRHPITDTGILSMTRRMVDFAEQNRRAETLPVEFLPGAAINGRKATCVRLVYPVAQPEPRIYLVRIFVDDQFQIPIRYEAHQWDGDAGHTPELLEEYTYVDVRLNNGFADADFDPKNPGYQFP